MKEGIKVIWKIDEAFHEEADTDYVFGEIIDINVGLQQLAVACHDDKIRAVKFDRVTITKK